MEVCEAGCLHVLGILWPGVFPSRKVLGQPLGLQWGAHKGLGLLGAYNLCLCGVFIGDG